MKNPCRRCLIKMMCSTMCYERLSLEQTRKRRIETGIEIFNWLINMCLLTACLVTIFSIAVK
jgi:hypothetical protein